MGCVRRRPSISTGPSGSQKAGRQFCPAPCSSKSWCHSLHKSETFITWKQSKTNALLLLWLTVVTLHFVQEPDALQMFGRGDGQRENVSDGFVEAWVGAGAERNGLVFVLQEVLHMAHLMVHSDQVIHSHNGALFYPGNTSRHTITVQPFFVRRQ